MGEEIDTASEIIQVYKTLSDENKVKLGADIIRSFSAQELGKQGRSQVCETESRETVLVV